MNRGLIEKLIIYTAFGLYYDEDAHLGDSCIQNFHLGRYIVGYMVGTLVTCGCKT